MLLAKPSCSLSTGFGGSSVALLLRFYENFGFVENKGRDKDYAISDSMYRQPTGVPEALDNSGTQPGAAW